MLKSFFKKLFFLLKGLHVVVFKLEEYDFDFGVSHGWFCWLWTIPGISVYVLVSFDCTLLGDLDEVFEDSRPILFGVAGSVFLGFWILIADSVLRDIADLVLCSEVDWTLVGVTGLLYSFVREFAEIKERCAHERLS